MYQTISWTRKKNKRVFGVFLLQSKGWGGIKIVNDDVKTLQLLKFKFF